MADMANMDAMDAMADMDAMHATDTVKNYGCMCDMNAMYDT